jgi:hypothetical protein
MFTALLIRWLAMSRGFWIGAVHAMTEAEIAKIKAQHARYMRPYGRKQTTETEMTN